MRLTENSIEFRMDDHWNVVLHYDGDFQSSHLQHTICMGNCNHPIPIHIRNVYEAIEKMHRRR